MGQPIGYTEGWQVELSKLRCISVLEDCFNLRNSVDPDEMQHNAAFHQGYHCLPKYPFRGIQYTKG